MADYKTLDNRVTTEALREMKMGETRTFDLPDAKAISSGKTLAYYVQHIIGCRFSAVSDFTNNRLALTKNPRA